MFRPRPPLERLEPWPQPRPQRPPGGLGATLAALRAAGALGGAGEEEQEEPGEAAEGGGAGRAYMRPGPPGRADRRERRREALRRRAAAELQRRADEWAPPRERPEATGDPFRTLFVGRLAYGCSEEELRAAMERFAAVDRVVIVKDLAGKPRGYGFVEFREAEGMKSAYRRTNHLEIAGRRVVVDVERGRTVKGWLPRRAGGGLGGESRAPRPTKRELKRLNQLQGQNSRPGWGAPPPRGPGAYSGAGFGGRGRFEDEAELERARRRRDDRDRRDRDRDRERGYGERERRDHRERRDYRERERDYRGRERERDYRDRR